MPTPGRRRPGHGSIGSPTIAGRTSALWPKGAGERCGSGKGATTFLAGEIRTYARTPEDLLWAQRRALIPLEIEVLDGAGESP